VGVDLSEGVVEGKSGANAGTKPHPLFSTAIDIGNPFSAASRKYAGDYSPGKQASYAELTYTADRKRNEVGRIPLAESLFAYRPLSFFLLGCLPSFLFC
jgi:hypothetical protein